MPEFICVSWSLFSIFSWKNWRHFAVTLRCVPTRVCWPVCPWLFKFFSMPRTRLTTGRQNVLLPAPSMSALPFSEVLVAVFQQLLQAPRFLFRMRLQSLWPTLFISPAQLSLVRFVQRTSLPVFQRGSSPVSSVVFPALFSSVVSRVCYQLCLGCCQLVFFSCRYVEIAAFFVSPFTAVSITPDSCSALSGSVVRGSDYCDVCFSSVYLHSVCLV